MVRNVTQGVLVSNVARNAFANRHYFIGMTRESMPRRRSQRPRRRRAAGFRSVSSSSKMPIEYIMSVDCPAIFSTSCRLCLLALSPPSLRTMRTFFTAAGLYSYPGSGHCVRERSHTRGWRPGDRAPSLSGTGENHGIGQAIVTFSLKLTMDIRPSGLLAWTKVRAAAITSDSLDPMLPL